jgi:hypothetical protein
MVPLFHVADNPVGNPLTVPMPVAPPVVIVMFGERIALMQVVRVGGDEAVLLAITLSVPVAFTLPHPPVKGML